VNWSDEEIEAGIEHCFEDAEDIFLVDASLNASRGGYQLIAKCESDSGITIDQLARVNRSINNSLLLPGLDITKVTVEVTSPGSNFPVMSVRHFRRFVGHHMKIEHRSDAAPNPLECEIIDVNDETLSLRTENGEVSLDFADVNQGTVKLRW